MHVSRGDRLFNSKFCIPYGQCYLHFFLIENISLEKQATKDRVSEVIESFMEMLETKCSKVIGNYVNVSEINRCNTNFARK